MAEGTCTESWRRRVSAYHDGGIVSDERTAIETHIHSCSSCQSLLTTYDKVYRGLRRLPGFEGPLTLTPPGSRKGLGAANRPMLTWPGRSYANSPEGSQAARTALLNNIGIALAVFGLLFASFVIINRDMSPSALVGSVPSPTPEPTIGVPLESTPNGTPCANTANESKGTQSYLFVDDKATIWHVDQCKDPVKVITLANSNFYMGQSSPDNRYIPIVIAATEITNQSMTILDTIKNEFHPLNLNSLGKDVSAISMEEMGWNGSSNLIIRANTNLYQINIETFSVVPLDVNDAFHLVSRTNGIFYSTLVKNRLLIYRFDLAQKTKTEITTLPNSVNCVNGSPSSCPQSKAWDISHMEKSLVYYGDGSIRYWELDGKTEFVSFDPYFTVQPQSITFSPDDMQVAIIEVKDSTNIVEIGSLENEKQIHVNGQNNVVWRNDSAAVILTSGYQPSSKIPQLTLLETGQQISMKDMTSQYIWLSS
jgi:hypothetical protein